MKEHIVKRSISYLLTLCILLGSSFCMVSCDSKAESGLPSRADAEKIQSGTTLTEAAEILGQIPTAFGSGVWYVRWKLDDGTSAYSMVVRRYDENGNPYYTVGALKHDPLNAGSGGRLEDYPFGGIAKGWDDFERYMEKEHLRLPKGFYYPSAFACLGEDPAICYVPDWNGSPCYQYVLTAWTDPEHRFKDLDIDVTIRAGVTKLPYNTTTLSSEMTQGQSSMLTLQVPEDPDSVIIYNQNGLIYTYDTEGDLQAIEWVDNGTYFCISNGGVAGWKYFINLVPEAIPENSILGRLLSLDDAVAMDAWNELKTYITEHNPKQIPYTEIIICSAVAVIGVGMAVLLIIHGKRTKKAATQQALTEQEPTSEE